MRAKRFHQIRKGQRRSTARSQQLPDALERRDPLQFFGSVARSVAERPAFGDAVKQTLLVETVDVGHNRGIRLTDLAVGQQFANRGAAMRPKLLQHLLLEGTQLRPST